MMLIGIAGRARSGKDTVAAALASNLGLYQYAFAEPLKVMLKSVFGDHFHVGDRSGICPETGRTYRHMMQTLGTELGRNLWNEEVWINLVQRRWEKLQQHPVTAATVFDARMGPEGYKGMILSDVRFPSEADWIARKGGVVVMVNRAAIHGVGMHASEQQDLSPYVNHRIDNDGTLEDLYAKVDLIAQAITHGHR